MKWLMRIGAAIFIAAMVAVVAIGSFTLYIVAQLPH